MVCHSLFCVISSRVFLLYAADSVALTTNVSRTVASNRDILSTSDSINRLNGVAPPDFFILS